jgi:adhesin/invasin
MNTKHVNQAWLLALLVAGSGCDSRSLKLHLDAAVRDGSSNVDVAPISQPPVGGQCADGYAPCGQGDGLRCYDLTRSLENCGSCGNACASGIACQAGACQQSGCKGALSFKTQVLGSNGAFTTLGDFDGDGILDLVGVADSASPMSLFYGVGDGTFSAGPDFERISDWILPDAGLPTLGPPGWQAVAADLDGDNRLDLVSVRGSDSAVTVRLGSGERTAPFGPPMRYPIAAPASNVILADFDGDGRLDLVVHIVDAFEYWRGQGDGQFVQHVTIGAPGASSWYPGFAQAIDWNNDGSLDLVYDDAGFMGIFAGPELGVGSGLRYRLGRGDGTFGAEVACGIAMGLAGDLDHDGRPDVISSSAIMGASLLLGISGCGPSTVLSITDWTKEGGVAFADLNNDGHQDVILDDNRAIMVHVGDGKGGFPHELTIPAPTMDQWSHGVFLVGDLNRDGKMDVVFSRDGGWGVLLNTCQ